MAKKSDTIQYPDDFFDRVDTALKELKKLHRGGWSKNAGQFENAGTISDMRETAQVLIRELETLEQREALIEDRIRQAQKIESPFSSAGVGA